MGFSNFLYRQKQKIKYHLAENELEKLLAEINRHSKVIELGIDYFTIKGIKFRFPIDFLYVIRRFNDLIFLMNQDEVSLKINNHNLEFLIDNLRLNVKTAEEIFIIREVYYQKSYNIDIGREFSVIDVGMNVGFTSLYFANRADVKKVYSYEPFSATFQDAETNIKLNPKYESKIIRKNVGFGLKNESVSVQFSSELKGKNNTQSESSLQKESQHLETIDLICAKDEINRIIDENDQECIVIKLDCEGAEFEIFESFGEQKIPKNIVAFMIEWHYKDPEPIISKLISNNFKTHCTYNVSEIGFIVAIR